MFFYSSQEFFSAYREDNYITSRRSNSVKLYIFDTDFYPVGLLGGIESEAEEVRVKERK